MPVEKSILTELASGQFEQKVLPWKLIYYGIEHIIGSLLFRRLPPQSSRLLNLGCGSHCFSGWINADIYAFKRKWREPKFRPNWMLDISRPWRCPNNHWAGIFSDHALDALTYSQAVFALQESIRTLQPGGWFRISLSCAQKYVHAYISECHLAFFKQFPSSVVALSFLTQMNHHKSIWDQQLIMSVLTEIGFINVRAVAFREGSDLRLLMDDPGRCDESMYVEAQKSV